MIHYSVVFRKTIATLSFKIKFTLHFQRIILINDKNLIQATVAQTFPGLGVLWFSYKKKMHNEFNAFYNPII